MNMYEKTLNGQQEIDANAAGLSMMERRILILINGEKDVDTLAKLSLCDDIGGVIDRLLELEMIEPSEPTLIEADKPTAQSVDTPATVAVDSSTAAASETPQAATAETSTAADADSTEFDENAANAREFMCNTLQTFGNRARIAALHNQIAETTNIGTLKELIKPWYQAISDTPGGMYQADDLRKDVLKLLDQG